MTKKFDIVSIGELLVDMTPASTDKSMVFEANPGGAPCNVLAMAAKLGAHCAFIGKVGADAFGNMLITTLERLGIETAGIVRDGSVPTTLAIIAFDENNERSFSFYRNPGADQMLRSDEVDTDIVKTCKILHFGTMSLTEGDSRGATMHAVETAKANGSMISFDPNIRLFLWKNEDMLRKMLNYGLSNCTILKMSEDEAIYQSGICDPEAAMEAILKKYPNISVGFLTLGEKGSMVFGGGGKVRVDAVPQKSVVDTTGAGDAFYGVCLYYIAKCGISDLTMEQLAFIAERANAAGSIVTGRYGSMRIMPEKIEIEETIGTQRKSE